MICVCPVCDLGDSEAIFSLDQAPIFQLLKVEDPVTAEDFGSLDIVRCLACGHLYNRAYNLEVSDRMYRDSVLSNVPVHVTMSGHLEQIAEWIGEAQYAGKHIIEVGAGSGYLARVLSQRARSVTIFEPSLGFQKAKLPESNISIINEPFQASLVDEPADLVVCRHVLEHMSNPLELLREIRIVLKNSGRLYLEVPRAEYIEERASLFDLHYPHVQYFHEQNLSKLAARAGFRVERQWRLKNDHDLGLLLQPAPEQSASLATPVPFIDERLQERLEYRRSQGSAFLRRLDGKVGLYGASWHGLSFLNIFQLHSFAIALDDNMDHVGYGLYSPRQMLPVREATARNLVELDAVVIVAYLHERPIVEKLQQIGFTGITVSIEPELIELPVSRPYASTAKNGLA